MKRQPSAAARTLALQVSGIGLIGPGLADWTAAAALLGAPQGPPPDWQPQPTAIPTPTRLPATERRRAGALVKLCIAVADQACAMAGLDPSTLATVFSSSTGEPANCHAMCEALAAPQPLVSPTRFTNSVHNAASGYWHIATHSRAPATALAAYDASFAAGLLEAASQCASSGQPVLLVAADLPYPEPLRAKRPVADALALALLLQPADASARTLRLQLCADVADPADPANPADPAEAAGAADAADPADAAGSSGAAAAADSSAAADAGASRCAHPALEALRRGIPAAQALPLLQALAGAAPARLRLPAWPGLGLQLDLDARR